MSTAEILDDRRQLEDRAIEQRLAVLIRRARSKTGKRQNEVAEQIGQYQAFIARIENGRRSVSLPEYIRIARAVGLDPVRGLRELLKGVDI